MCWGGWGACPLATVYTERLENNLWDSLFSFYCVYSRNQTQVISLGHKHLYPRSHFASPQVWFLTTLTEWLENGAHLWLDPLLIRVSSMVISPPQRLLQALTVPAFSTEPRASDCTFKKQTQKDTEKHTRQPIKIRREKKVIARCFF